MMFLQFVPLGLWVVTVSTYIGMNTGAAGSGMFDSWFVGIAGISGALGALATPLFFGAMADSWFRTERLIALLNLGCAGLLMLMCRADSQAWFLAWMIGYYQLGVPAITLCHSLALRHLAGAKAAFPFVRSWGTVGWIAALVIVGSAVPWIRGVPSVEVEGSTQPMQLAAGAHLLMAALALTLPRTPPLAGMVTWRTLLGGCVALVRRHPRLLLFLVVSFFATISAQFYNLYINLYLNRLGIESAAAKISLGQVVEIACMLILPWLLLRWGPKRIFVWGILAWAVRYVCLAFGGGEGWPLVLIYTALVLHGACYTFVYVTAFLYVDHASPPETKSAAQGLLAVVTSGLGHLTGSLMAGAMQARFLTPAGVEPAPYDWQIFFLIAAGLSVLAVLLFWLLMGFHREMMPEETA